MLRYPAVSADQIAFVYAGDIWVVAEEGRDRRPPELAARRRIVPAILARRLALAYSADYDGNTDVYVVPVAGGEPRAAHLSPDGRPRRRLDARRQARAVRLGRESGRQRYSQFFTVGLDGRTAGEAADPVRRVRRLFARRRSSSPTCRCRRTSARGSATAAAGRPDIWLFDLKTLRGEEHHQRSPATTRSRCGTATRSTSSPTAAPNQRNNIWALRRHRRARRGRSRSSTTSTSRSRRPVPTRSCSRPAAACT